MERNSPIEGLVMVKYDSVLDAIGHTPLIRINRLAADFTAQIYAKFEATNPCGSIKERVALHLIQSAEAQGQLHAHSILVEPSSGNTGIGIALVGAVKGYPVKILMPETASPERRQILRAFGAEVVLTPASEGMQGAITRAKAMAAADPNVLVMNQFENPANPDSHRASTACEIWDDLQHQVDVLVACVGTGGTLTGVGETLRARNPNLTIIAVEPARSPVLSGGSPAPHQIQGMGAGFIPPILNTTLFTEIIGIDDTEAFETARLLARTEGLFVGPSSGAAMAAALRYARRMQRPETIVVIFPDTGERYLSTSLWALE